MARARDAGNYLLEAQQAAGTGVFGFPLVPAAGSEAERLVARFAREARAKGLIDHFARGGWIIDDFGNGDLQYDNGLAGQALIALASATGGARYLDAARRAGRWAMQRPIVPNFNYNGFTAALLADLYRATGEQVFLEEAVVRAELGILSGQVADGPYTGSWIDPHNKRLVYRAIMIGQLADLVRALPADHERRPVIVAGLKRALRAWEAPQDARNAIGNIDSAARAYCKLDMLPLALRRELGLPSATQKRLWSVGAGLIARGEAQFGPAATAALLTGSHSSPPECRRWSPADPSL